MSLWHQQALADIRQAELRRQAELHHDRHRRPTGASGRTHVGTEPDRTPTLRQRLGILMVEAGLHLITVSDGRGAKRAQSPAGSPHISR